MNGELILLSLVETLVVVGVNCGLSRMKFVSETRCWMLVLMSESEMYSLVLST